MRIFQEAAAELSKGLGVKEKKEVMWILDSFSALVSLALENPSQKSEYAAVIDLLYRMSSSLIPVPVCSSATTAGSLGDSKKLSLIAGCNIII